MVDLWLADRRARLNVTWNGPYTGLILGGICAISMSLYPEFGFNSFLFKMASVAYLTVFLNVNPLLLGYRGTRFINTWIVDIDIVPPGDTLVTAGPHGTLSNMSLDGSNIGMNYSALDSSLPAGQPTILRAGQDTNQIVAFAYGLGSGLSAILFAIGTAGVFVRRNLITILLSIEIMLNAVNLTFVAFGRVLGSADGQIIVFFVMTVAAAEAAVGLAIVIALFRHRESLNPEAFTSLKW